MKSEMTSQKEEMQIVGQETQDKIKLVFNQTGTFDVPEFTSTTTWDFALVFKGEWSNFHASIMRDIELETGFQFDHAFHVKDELFVIFSL